MDRGAIVRVYYQISVLNHAIVLMFKYLIGLYLNKCLNCDLIPTSQYGIYFEWRRIEFHTMF
jgi:hypothetical protein